MSLFQKITDLSDKWFYTESGKFISTRAAKEIQKSAHKKNIDEVHAQSTPPYREIVEQLDVHNEQVFKAAVYNLYKIAECNPQYRDDILQILESYIHHEGEDKKLVAYVQEKYQSLQSLENM